FGAGVVGEPLRFGDEVERALVALHGERCRGRNLAGDRQRRADRVAVDVLHQPEPQRFLGVDVAPGEEEIACRALPDELYEPPDVARAQVDTEATARDREARAERRDPDVARG